MVKTAVQKACVDVHREKRQSGNSQAIGNAQNGQGEKNQHNLLPDGWEEKVPRDEADNVSFAIGTSNLREFPPPTARLRRARC
jgi:hypothetical protein